MLYHIAVQGAARRSRLIALSAQDTSGALLETGPLGLYVNSDFNADLINSIRQLASLVEPNDSLDDFIPKIASICIAASGAVLESDNIIIRRALHEANFSSVPLIICEDILAIPPTYGIRSGMVILVGTGSNVLVKRDNTSIRVGGWGAELGDPGSAYHIGKLALIHLLEAADFRRDRNPEFEAAILSSIALDSPSQIVAWYHALRLTPNWKWKIADIAYSVVKLDERDNNNAREILQFAENQLFRSVQAGVKRGHNEKLIDPTEELPIILDGRILKHCNYYKRLLDAHLSTLRTPCLPTLRYHYVNPNSQYDPIVGALSISIANELNGLSGNEYSEYIRKLKQCTWAFSLFHYD